MSKVEKRKSFFQNLYPNFIYEKVEDIPYNMLWKEDIKLILMDTDNTLINYNI